MFEQVIILSGSQEFERNPVHEIERKRVVGHNFASGTHMISKEILDQNIQGAEVEPCNINRGHGSLRGKKNKITKISSESLK